MNVPSPGPSNKANIFLGLFEHELNISVHIRFDLERYLLNILHRYSIYMARVI